jgi:hypothetical protein
MALVLLVTAVAFGATENSVEKETYGAAASYHSLSANIALVGGGSSATDCTSGFINTVSPLIGSSSPAPLSIARCGLAATSVGDTTLFAGGNSKFGYVAAIDRYVNGTLQQKPRLKLTTKRSWVSGTSAGMMAFFVGGYSKANQSKSAGVDVFDGKKVAVSAARSLPSGRMFHAAAAIDSMNGTIALWVGGGTDEDGVTDAVHVMNFDSNTGLETSSGGWNLFQLSSKRAKLASATVHTKTDDQTQNGFVLFAGGEGAKGMDEQGWTCTGSFCMSSNVDIFSTDGTLLKTVALSEPRSRLAAVTLGCRGELSSSCSPASLPLPSRFPASLFLVRTNTHPTPHLSPPFFLYLPSFFLNLHSSSFSSFLAVIFAGGKTLSGYSSAVDVVDLCNSSMAISAGPALSEARSDLAGAAAGGGTGMSNGMSAYFVGGLGDNGVTSAVDAVL